MSISNSTLKGQTRGMLGKRRCLRCGQPLSVDLDHRVSELVARADRQLLSVCNITLCQHLGVAPEEGAYSRDKMSDPAYKPPLHFQLALRLQNGGPICGTLRYFKPFWVHSAVLTMTEARPNYCIDLEAMTVEVAGSITPDLEVVRFILHAKSLVLALQQPNLPKEDNF